MNIELQALQVDSEKSLEGSGHGCCKNGETKNTLTYLAVEDASSQSETSQLLLLGAIATSSILDNGL